MICVWPRRRKLKEASSGAPPALSGGRGRLEMVHGADGTGSCCPQALESSGTAPEPHSTTPLYSLRRPRCRQTEDLNPGLWLPKFGIPHTPVGKRQGEVAPGLGSWELEVAEKAGEGGWVEGTAVGNMDEGQLGAWKTGVGAESRRPSTTQVPGPCRRWHTGSAAQPHPGARFGEGFRVGTKSVNGADSEHSVSVCGVLL